MPIKSNFVFKIDSNIKHSGNYSLMIVNQNEYNNPMFGCAGFRLDNIKGKEIEVSAYMKLEKISDAIGLLVRIDDEDKILAFDNMEREKIKGTKNWKKYNVKLIIPDGAKHA